MEPTTTTSPASYTEERPLATLRQVAISSFFVASGLVVSLFTYPVAFSAIVPLSLSILLFREWKMIRNFGELTRKGELRYEPKYWRTRSEANKALALVLLIIVGPMALSAFLPPLPWLSTTMAFVMAWPLSNVLEYAVQKWAEVKTGGKVVKYYKWVSYGEEVVMKEYGWKVKRGPTPG